MISRLVRDRVKDKVTVNNSLPVAFSSIFEWVLIGTVPMSPCNYLSSLPVSLTMLIISSMNTFWHVEEPTSAAPAVLKNGRCGDGDL